MADQQRLEMAGCLLHRLCPQGVRSFMGMPTPSSLTLGSPLIPISARKPIRFWFEVGDRDPWYPNPLDDGMHDWVLANEKMAEVLAAKGYHYQFIFSRNAGHVDGATFSQTFGPCARMGLAGLSAFRSG